MTTSPTVPLVLRDQVAAALSRQNHPVTAEQLAALVTTGGSGLRQVRRALAELEDAGQAVRQRGRGAPPGSGRAPDLWRAIS